ncbi:chymotrypsinogen A-like isoform X2 [Mya arenaria]|uniref:chymotrypsinogen A-like isoform X2 n=1 Tax=Mya arenaria TaxID=6604 RepID=UPI0022E23CC7|nr:chymotrypsinogen A-like isoform X2 [Mya arenaria]
MNMIVHIGLTLFCAHIVANAAVPQTRGKGETCVAANGVCSKAADCTGWVDIFDVSCGHNVCCLSAPSTLHPEPPSPNNDTCGLITRVPDRNPFARIVGGNEAVEGEWPWQVAFLDAAGDYFCGGTLITPEFVLTAAHCFVRHSEVGTRVVLGEHHLMHNTGNEVIRNIKTIVKHSKYVPTSHMDDVAFVQLDSPVDVSGHYVRTACFGSRDYTWTPADKCYASGWGYTNDYQADGHHLRHVQVTLVDTATCATAWGTNANVTANNVCAGNGLYGTCQGDSGGPLVCLRDGQYHVIGVTSFGYYTCSMAGYPDVFTRVTAYLDWITSYMLLMMAVS